MAVKIADNIEPTNRDSLALSSAWFYLLYGSDVDVGVEAILENSSETVDATVNNKYIVRSASNKPSALNSVAALENGDIVMYNGNTWEIHKDVSNTKSNYGFVFDKRTKLLYQYDTTNGWLPLLRSGKIDGGTFS
jgi:hypothetical protein